MFVLRGMMVALGFFGVFYCLLSLLVVCVWRCASLLRQDSAVGRARLLFGLRIFPVLGSAFLTLAFALPAFFLLEGGMDEDLGTLLFSVGTLMLLGAGLFRVVTAQVSASRVVAKWLKGSRSLDVDVSRPALPGETGCAAALVVWRFNAQGACFRDGRCTFDTRRVAGRGPA